MAALHPPICDFGAAASDFSLPGVDGKHWTLADCRGPRGLLVMFICNHCPYVQAVITRIKELGAVSVRKMSGIEESVKFPLPKGLKLDAATGLELAERSPETCASSG